MKKIFIIIISFILTFFLSSILSLYNLGDKITLITSLYLVFIFTIISYILLTIHYIITKKKNKEKISFKKIISMILFFLSLLLLLGFVVVLNLDYLNYSYYSNPFYIHVISRSIEFLLPSLLIFFIALFFRKK